MSFSDSLSNLSPAFADPLSSFLEDARSQGFSITINSGYRSPEQQAAIMADHFTQYGFSEEDAARFRADVETYGPIAAGQRWEDRINQTNMRSWIALPGSSNHQRGLAADLGYGSDAARSWAHANAANYGLHFRLDHEPWHIEPANISAAMISASTQPNAASTEAASADANRTEDERNSRISRMLSDASEPPDGGSDRGALVDKVVEPAISNALADGNARRLDAAVDDFVNSLTDQQRMIEMAQFQRAQRSGASDFRDWFRRNRFGAYIEAALGQNPDQQFGGLTSQQRQILTDALQVAEQGTQGYSARVMGLA